MIAVVASGGPSTLLSSSVRPYAPTLFSRSALDGPLIRLQVTATEIPYVAMSGGEAFTPGGPERAMARLELGRAGVIEAVSGLRGFKLLRLGGSAFHGFVRDEYTTLPDTTDRLLATCDECKSWFLANSHGLTSRALPKSPSDRALPGLAG